MTEETGERWLPVVGYEGLYEVSDRGRLRSLDRAIWRDGPRYSQPHLVPYRGRPVPTHLQPKGGYVGVQLWRDNRFRSFRVHRLVLEAFVGPCPDGMETLHGNGIRSDNRLSNLRWGTWEENYADRVTHGTAPSGLSGDLCKRGHALNGANLRAAATAKGRRGCLACARALNSWRWFATKNPGHDKEQWIQDRADRNYQQIMAGAA